MYKRHEILSIILGSIISAVATYYNWNFKDLADMAITIASIAIGVYIAAVSSLLGSKYASNLQKQDDPEIKSKSLLGTLSEYFRGAGTSCMALIILSSIHKLPLEGLPELVRQTLSSIAFSLFLLNLFFIWLILKFLINSLGRSIRK